MNTLGEAMWPDAGSESLMESVECSRLNDC